MQKLFTVLINTLILTSLISGCVKHRSSKGHLKNHKSANVVEEKVAKGWLPDDAKVRCAVESCPPQVGVVIYIFPAVGGFHKIRRCSAFQTGPAQIATNGHCEEDTDHDRAQGYFITAGSIPGGRQMRQIIGVSLDADGAPRKHFTPPPNRSRHHGGHSDEDSGRPDVVFLDLDGELPTEPLSLVQFEEPFYDKLQAFVINADGAKDLFRIDRLDCEVRRHDAIFPYDLKENPDVIRALNCRGQGGNSGGPMFAPGSAKVQAVLQGVNEEDSFISATNMRCLNAPAGSCLVVDQYLTNRRQSEARITSAED